MKPKQGSTTADPYLTLGIARDWSKFFRTGGYFFRTATSTIEQSSLFPRWDREPIILFYYGIKSELENEELLIKVFDFDKIQSDHILGSAKGKNLFYFYQNPIYFFNNHSSFEGILGLWLY